MVTASDSGTLSLASVGGDSGIWVGGVNQLEDLIISRFLSWYAHTWSCLGIIRTEARFCVKPRLVSGEGLTISHCGVEMNRLQKWYLPPPEEEFFIPRRGDRILINTFLLKE